MERSPGAFCAGVDQEPAVNSKTSLKWCAVLFATLAMSACATGSRGDGLAEVNEFVAMIGKVHTDSELASQKAHAAQEEFSAILAFNWKHDAVAAYAEFSTAVDQSSAQLAALKAGIESMQRSADPVFKKWASDLDAFASLDMRLKSQQRLMETRKRYDAIVASLEPALVAYDGFDKRMRDYATFLAHDFNEASVAALRGDDHTVHEMVATLDARFGVCQQAAREYVQAAALPSGAAPAEPAAAEKAPPKKASARSDG
jgi:hypothetical protein